MKRYLGIDVHGAAVKRVKKVFDDFPQLYVSFSGGKDSTVLLHLAAQEAQRRKRKIGVLFIDWEAQYTHTIRHVEEVLTLYKEVIEPYWVCLPLLTTNACSQFEPEWICWEPTKDWVRDLPVNSISDHDFFSFYECPMTFEDFVPAFAHWYGAGEKTACLVGIRTAESLNRYRTISKGAYGKKGM